MTLRRTKNPGARRHVARTAAQEAAFRVFRLRGLWWMAHALTGERLVAAKALIDAEIARLGAETETDRDARRRRESLAADEAEDAARTFEAAREAMFEELPF